MINHTASLDADSLVCRVHIVLNSLTHNLNLLKRSFADATPVCMVKANAYGHGAGAVAQQLEKSGANWFGVATLQEGVQLREEGIRGRILVMAASGAHNSVPLLLRYDLTPVISSVYELEAINKQSKNKLKIHLDLDTGMSRGGFLDLDEKLLTYCSSVAEIEGVCTHLANAENQDCPYAKMQFERFEALVKKIANFGLEPRYIHVDKSSSILCKSSQAFADKIKKVLPKSQFLMRPGLALYGVDPTGTRQFAKELKPSLSWEAPITLRKRVPKGTPVGYDGIHVTKRETELAMVRVGYADGLNRLLSDRGHLLVANRVAPILGRISMDLTAIDVTDLANSGLSSCCEVGKFATIIGGEGKNYQGAYELAEACDTIPYEILTSISLRVKRLAS